MRLIIIIIIIIIMIIIIIIIIIIIKFDQEQKLNKSQVKKNAKQKLTLPDTD